eukprot:927123-Pyramimonas_sp.AAC.2
MPARQCDGPGSSTSSQAQNAIRGGGSIAPQVLGKKRQGQSMVTKNKVAFKTLKKRSLAERPARISPTIEIECHARAGTNEVLRQRVVKLEEVYEDAKHMYMVRSPPLSAVAPPGIS